MQCMMDCVNEYEEASAMKLEMSSMELLTTLTGIEFLNIKKVYISLMILSKLVGPNFMFFFALFNTNK